MRERRIFQKELVDAWIRGGGEKSPTRMEIFVGASKGQRKVLRGEEFKEWSLCLRRILLRSEGEVGKEAEEKKLSGRPLARILRNAALNF